MLDQDTIDNQFALLATHRRTLAALLVQHAQFSAGHIPAHLVNGIVEARTEIARIKAVLRAGGVQVEDEPNDDAPPQADRDQPTPAAPHVEATVTVHEHTGGTVIGVQLTQPTLAPALHQLRAPVGDFVGREREIDQLVQALGKAATGGAAAAISGVRGMGGIGKTELAYAAAQQLAARFPDAQLLIELRGAGSDPLTPQQALQTLIRSFEREAKLPDDLTELRALYCDKLTHKRVLILADDAKDAAQVRVLLPPAGSALLVTSRNRFSLPGMAVFNLGTLPSQEAEKLLLELCPRIGEHASALAKLCGYLPLALRVSASLLANSTRSVERYLERLEAERLSHLIDPDDLQASVEASLRVSYEALERAVQVALAQLGVFAASFDQAALSVLEVEGDAEVILDLLMRRSLLEWDATLQRYSLHELVRAFAAARLEDTEAVWLRYARHYAQVADLAGNRYNQGGVSLVAGLALFDQERAHIDAGWGWAMAHAGEQEADVLLLDFARATASIGDLRYDTRRERIPQLKAQCAAAQRRGQRDHEGAALGNLGIAYKNLSDTHRAIAFYKQALLIDREIGDRRGEGAVLSNLGSAYYLLGEARRAIEFYEQALLIDREIGDRRGEGAVLGNLGIAYKNLGEARRAIEFYEQYLAIAREIGDRRGEGAALGNLGRAYADLGDARRAIEFYEQHLAIAREIGDRRSEGAALGNLGRAYATLREIARAIDFCQQYLVIMRETNDRGGEAEALNDLGYIYSANNPHRAIQLHEQALALIRQVGNRHREGRFLIDLGETLMQIGELSRATVCFEMAITIAREIGDRRGEATASWNLGLALEQQGDLAQAAELMQVRVDFEQEIGHSDAEKHTAYLEQLQQRLAGGDSTPPAGEPAES